MLYLPAEDAEGEARRVPLNRWGRKVYVRSWRDLGFGFFLIDYTNAKNAKSRAWRYAVVKQGFKSDWDYVSQSYIPDHSSPTWIPYASVNSGKAGGEDGFNAVVNPNGFEDMDWYWPKSAKVWHSDREEACRLMLGFTEVMHGVVFNDNPEG